MYRVFRAPINNQNNWVEVFLPKIPYQILKQRDFANQCFLFRDGTYKYYWWKTAIWTILIISRKIKNWYLTSNITMKIIIPILIAVIGAIIVECLFHFVFEWK
jgi:hypothetical protein